MTSSLNVANVVHVTRQNIAREASVKTLKQLVLDITNSNPAQTEIYYAANHIDAIAGAAMVHQHFTKLHDVNVRAVPIHYGTPFTINEGIKTAVFVNICPTIDELKQLSLDGITVMVIDHHKSIVEDVVGKISTMITQMNAPSLFVFADGAEMSGAELAWHVTENNAHKYTVERIGMYDRMDKNNAWVETHALASMMKNRMPTVPSSKKMDIMNEFLNNIPNVIISAAIKLYNHHKTIVVGMAASVFNTAQVIVDDENNRRGLVFMCGKEYIDDVADLVLAADKNISAVCGITLVKDRVEYSFRSNKQSTVSALNIATALNGGGHTHSAGCTGDIKSIARVTDFFKQMVLRK